MKFDPESFKSMMSRIEDERIRSPYEDLEPDPEFMPAPWCCRLPLLSAHKNRYVGARLQHCIEFWEQPFHAIRPFLTQPFVVG